MLLLGALACTTAPAPKPAPAASRADAEPRIVSTGRRGTLTVDWAVQGSAPTERMSRDSSAEIDLSAYVETAELTPGDQAALARLNAIRANPSAFYPELAGFQAEAARLEPCGDNPRQLDELLVATPRPPLAPHRTLATVAAAQATDLVVRQFFDHVNPDGIGPNERVRRAGIDLSFRVETPGGFAVYGDGLRDNQLEAIHTAYLETSSPLDPADVSAWRAAIDGLIVDWCITSRGHRHHLLGQTDLNKHDRWVGIGSYRRDAKKGQRNVREFGFAALTLATRGPEYFVTGAVWSDANSDGALDPGEGLAGEVVRLDHSGRWTRTNSGGGFSIPVADGTATALVWGEQRHAFTVGGENVWVSFDSPTTQVMSVP